MAAQSILKALDDSLRTGEGIREVVGAFYSLARSANDETRTQMLSSLDARFRAQSIDRVASVAVLAGALVELGADVREFPLAVFDYLLAQLDTIRGPDDETELPEAYYATERAAMACLSRSPELRSTLPQKPAIVAKLQRYQERYGFLGKMMQVLDDEPLVVLQPSTKRGFRFTMHGIADNFQLHLLLLGALAGKGIDGRAPSREALAAASDALEVSEADVESGWQLANWFGLRPGGEIDSVDFRRTWIWNEGVPSDIAIFDGTRVVLIGPSTMQRSWNAQRVFPGMVGRLEGPVHLAEAEVVALLRNMEVRAHA